MKKIFSFFKLIRTINVLVVVLTMVVVQLYFNKYILLRNNADFEGKQTDWSLSYLKELLNENIFLFYLLIFSTVLIVAAGNIINDYFDVKADRINKPDKLIIGKFIKRRWAMVLHWSFNSVGFILALYVGYKTQVIWIPIIAFVCINILWFYSSYYKRRTGFGNLLVAFLVALVPIYVLCYNFSFFEEPYYIYQNGFKLNISGNWFYAVIVITAGFAFLINLIREIVKDIMDVRGDLRLGAKTLPIKYGVKKTKIILLALFIVLLSIILFSIYGVFYFQFDVLEGNTMQFFGKANFKEMINESAVGYLLIATFIVGFISAIALIFSKQRNHYKFTSNALKIAMLFGLLTPLFL